MTNALIIIVVLAVLAVAIAFIVKEKRRGVVCIGCPAGATCASKGNPSATCSACGDVDEIVQQIKSQSQADTSKKI